MKRKLLLLLLIVINCTNLQKKTHTSNKETIKIASFNIQIFGRKKSSNTEILDILASIVTNYDIIAIQEIRDKSGQTMPRFLEKINSISTNNYSYLLSRRLGRSSSKESYVYLFNEKITYNQKSFVYDDTNDIFEREPFIAHFSVDNFDFALVNIHTKPKKAKEEIQALEQVILSITNEKDIIVLGDFNADGSYFSEKITNGLRNINKYTWIISDGADTTVAQSDNTYDRIVIQSEYTFEDYTWKRGVYRFDKIFTNVEPKKISDHYPVWAEFYTDKDSD